MLQTFVAVYSEKYSLATPGLMKYMSIVRELGLQPANWRFYDENFRMFREKYSVPWNQIHAESWLCGHSHRGLIVNYGTDTGHAQPTRKIPARPPAGYCFRFHRGQQCEGPCKFKHECFRCGNVSHLASNCLQSTKKHKADADKITNLSPATDERAGSPLGHLLPKTVPTPIEVDRLAKWPVGYNRSLYDQIISGFTFDFTINYKGDSSFRNSKNLVSAYQHRDVVESKLQKEFTTGRTAGPFDDPPFHNIHSSPLGVAPKKMPGEWRMIHNQRSIYQRLYS